MKLMNIKYLSVIAIITSCFVMSSSATTVTFFNNTVPAKTIWVGVDKNSFQRIDSTAAVLNTRILTTWFTGLDAVYWKYEENGPVHEKTGLNYKPLDLVKVFVDSKGVVVEAAGSWAA